MWSGSTLEQRRAFRRSALLTAALDLVGEAGAAGVTMRAVCRGAGLTTRYFYESFSSPEELLDILYRQVAEEFLAPVTSLVTATEPARVRAQAVLLVDKICRDHRKSRLFLIEPFSNATVGQIALAVMPRFTRPIQDQLGTILDDPTPRRLAALTLSSGSAGMFAAWLGGSLRASHEQVADHLSAVVTAYRSFYV